MQFIQKVIDAKRNYSKRRKGKKNNFHQQRMTSDIIWIVVVKTLFFRFVSSNLIHYSIYNMHSGRFFTYNGPQFSNTIIAATKFK